MRGAFLVLIYVVVSGLVLNSFMEQWELITANRGNGFLGLMNRTAEKPWIYRVLTPAIVNGATAALPARVKHALEPVVMEQSHLLKFPKIRNTPDWTVDNAIKYHLAYFFMFGCLFLSLFLIRALTGALFSPPPAFQDFGPVLGVLLLPLTFSRGGYMYDFPELLFMSVLTLCAVRRRWVLYYVLFILAILNKESDVFLILFFMAFAYREMSRRAFAAHLAVQAVLGFSLLVLLRHAYANHGGFDMQFNLPTNIRYLLRPASYLMFFDVYAPMIPVPRGFNLLSLVFLAYLVSYKWSEKPPAVRRLLVLTTAVNVPLFLWGGYKDELRNLSLIFPAVYLLGFHTLREAYAQGGRMLGGARQR